MDQILIDDAMQNEEKLLNQNLGTHQFKIDPKNPLYTNQEYESKYKTKYAEYQFQKT